MVANFTALNSAQAISQGLDFLAAHTSWETIDKYGNCGYKILKFLFTQKPQEYCISEYLGQVFIWRLSLYSTTTVEYLSGDNNSGYSWYGWADIPSHPNYGRVYSVFCEDMEKAIFASIMEKEKRNVVHRDWCSYLEGSSYGRSLDSASKLKAHTERW
jgi:hypothetical protein